LLIRIISPLLHYYTIYLKDLKTSWLLQLRLHQDSQPRNLQEAILIS